VLEVEQRDAGGDEKGYSRASMLGQVTALEDRLGLTPKAMKHLVWSVVADEVSERREEEPKADVRRIRALDRPAVS
jgi:hypothetical protein